MKMNRICMSDLHLKNIQAKNRKNKVICPVFARIFRKRRSDYTTYDHKRWIDFAGKR